MEEKAVKKIKRKKFSIKKFLILVLTLYIIACGIYYLFKLPIKNIIIKGNNLVSDYEIITAAKIKDYPSIFKTGTIKLEKRIKALDLVADVKIKKNLKGILTITIMENKTLFINNNTNKLVLSNGKEIADQNYLGIPVLLNYVPEDIYQDFIKGFKNIDENVIKMISEIEYSQYKNKKDEIIDNERFLLRMNDTNTVYINIPNINRLNYYQDIVLTKEDRGILYLDSNSSTNTIFENY